MKIVERGTGRRISAHPGTFEAAEKRQRTDAVQDAGAPAGSCSSRSVRDCASPLALSAANECARRRVLLAGVVIWVFITGLPLSAQAPAAGQAGLNAILLRLFGEFPGFTAKADVSFREKGSSETVTMRIGFAMRDGNARLDLDLADMKSKQLGQEELAGLKRAGLDKTTTILRVDRRVALLVYPAVEAYVELPLAKEEADDLVRPFRYEKKTLAKETLDGHPCEKTRVRVLGDRGERQEAVVWYATDLKNFPLKVQMDQEGATVVLHYRDVNLTKPAAAQFETPGGYAKHADPERLRQAAAFRLLQPK